MIWFALASLAVAGSHSESPESVGHVPAAPSQDHRAGPPAGVDLNDLDRWVAGDLFAESDGCWLIDGIAEWHDRVGPWSRRGAWRLSGAFVEGRWEVTGWEPAGPVTYDTHDGRRPGVFDGRPVQLELWAQRDDPAARAAALEGSRRGRRLARRLDRIEERAGVVTTSARWDAETQAVLATTSYPLGAAPDAARLDVTVTWPDGGARAVAERWVLDGTKLFPAAPFTPAVRLETLEATIRRRADIPLPLEERVRWAVRKVGLVVLHEHHVRYDPPRPCPAAEPAP